MITLVPEATYKEVTVRINGKGVVERRQVQGVEIAADRRHRAKSGQFIISRIDARHGASGLIPDELDGAVVTNDFPLFDVAEDRLDAAFLGWMSKTASFVELCKRASEGTTNRVRLSEDRFKALNIPLPPLDEQRRIVARIEELAAKVEEARGVRSISSIALGATLAMARRSFFGKAAATDWIRLSEHVTEIENGKSPATEGRIAEANEWAVLKVGAVSFGSFNERENKALPPSFDPIERYEVKVGDFLMSRANTSDLVGACAIVRATRPHLMLSDKIFRFIFKSTSDLVPEYLDHALKSPALRTQIVTAATGTSPTMKNISKEKVLALLIPDVPASKQRRVVAELDALQSKLDSVKALQTETAAELDAMLPAILDKAFKGEL
ncbi:MAG: restriction endonuclease subunit S [Betaproteobacteria bacterium]|nr:restriction endonuclease subunit S [Betaproteobacteria bacterium]